MGHHVRSAARFRQIARRRRRDRANRAARLDGRRERSSRRTWSRSVNGPWTGLQRPPTPSLLRAPISGPRRSWLQTLAPLWLTGHWAPARRPWRAIHYYRATRERSFAAVDCAGLQPYLIRSLLFGHNGLAESGRVGTIYLKSPEAALELHAELIEWSELPPTSARWPSERPRPTSSRQVSGRVRGHRDSPAVARAERHDDLPRCSGLYSMRKRSRPSRQAGNARRPWPCSMLGVARQSCELRDVVRTAAKRANGGRIEMATCRSPARAADDAKAAESAASRNPSRNWTRCSNRWSGMIELAAAEDVATRPPRPTCSESIAADWCGESRHSGSETAGPRRRLSRAVRASLTVRAARSGAAPQPGAENRPARRDW